MKYIVFLSCLVCSIHALFAQDIRYTQTLVSVPLPDSLFFAGERVPLEDFDVRERLERELIHNCYRHAVTLIILKRVPRWRKIIEQALEEEDVHKDFFYMAVAESDLNAYAESNKAATGMWQFMEGTAKEWGLKVLPDIDQRQDPILSTEAATKYIKFLYNKYNSWTIAAAAFNRGHGGMDKALKAQKVTSYYDLYLNQQTYRYIFRILAFKLILENPNQYGFCLSDTDYYKPLEFRKVTVTESIADLPAFAAKHKTNYKTLKVLNPWLDLDIKYSLTVPKGKKFVLRLPK